MQPDHSSSATKIPLISIVMAAHNGEVYLREAIDSMLDQRFENFEFIIIDDASTDSTKNIIESYDDQRIILLQNEHNIGLAASLNKGIRAAQGSYIARMDSDDIALPERLEKQVVLFEQDPELGLCGTHAELIGTRSGFIRYGADSDHLKCQMLFSCRLVHPSTMIRKSVLTENNIFYNENFKQAQDYELWSRLIPYCRFSNVQEVLLKYRFHKSQISTDKRQPQVILTTEIYRKILQKLGIDPTEEELLLHHEAAFYDLKKDLDYIKKLDGWFRKILEGNERNIYFPQNELREFLNAIFINTCLSSTFNGWQLWKYLNSNDCISYYKMNVTEYGKLIFKSLLRYS